MRSPLTAVTTPGTETLSHTPVDAARAKENLVVTQPSNDPPPERTPPERTRIAFVMEQTLGHPSFERALRGAVAQREDIAARWLPISYEPRERWEALPLIASNWSVRASIKARRALNRMVRRSGDADLYFFHTLVVSLLSSGWLADAGPVVISVDATPRDLDAFTGAYPDRQGTRVEDEVKLRIHRHRLRKATAVVAWSEWVRRSLIEEYGAAEDRITVIPAGTDIDFWGTREDDEPETPAVGRPARLLFVGGDFDRKGGGLLLDVFRDALADGCELHLVTNADVPVRDGVFVHPDVSALTRELREIFHRCDVFVLPTLADASPHAVVEAMAAGLPVVATRVGAVPEMVADGVNGFVVEPGDAAGLARALARLTQDEQLRRRMAAESRDRAVRLFDGAKNSTRVLDVCKAAVAAGRARPTG